jgi:two-component system sensor histidine kinase BaeS
MAREIFPLQDVRQHIVRLWHAVRKATRSLRVQMALGSALLALSAIMFIALTAIVTVEVYQRENQRELLSTQTTELATALGRRSDLPVAATDLPFSGIVISDPEASTGSAGTVTATTRKKAGFAYLWVMDASGNLIVSPPPGLPAGQTDLSQDTQAITAALRAALRGQTSEGTLPSGVVPILDTRLYTAAPIREDGLSNGKIVGAIALSTPPPAGRVAGFPNVISEVEILLFAALAAALIAATVAVLFSRRLTRPLADLTTAAEHMAQGSYATRVTVDAPDELHRLAATFNEMAAALERDLGEIRRQEHLRRELVANVSHELATPLTMIQGYTEALNDGVVRDANGRAETTQLIAREAARLRRLVDQLREVARYEAGAQSLERAVVALAPLVDETLSVLSPAAERKRVTMRATLPRSLPPVYADADRLVEILLNLLENALRHSPTEGTVEIGAEVEGGFVRLRIADSGPGVAPEERDRIFERFHRLDGARSSTTGGSGLGLAIVKSLVEAHGGTIRVEGRPAGGATFSFTLPIAAGRASLGAEAPGDSLADHEAHADSHGHRVRDFSYR